MPVGPASRSRLLGAEFASGSVKEGDGCSSCGGGGGGGGSWLSFELHVTINNAVMCPIKY